MRDVDINNPYIQARLDGFAEKLNALKPPPIDHRDASIDKHMGVSTEYLHRLMEEEGNKGLPRSCKGADLLTARNAPEWKDIVPDVSFNFSRELGLEFHQNALCFFYPEDGFIGWHTNEDAPGHTLLFTWSETGDGFYRFKDKDSGEIKTLPDKPGWVCRTGTYGDGTDLFGRLQWHCALTNEPRWSIAFCITSAEMTEMVVKDIECSDGRSII